VSSKFALIRVAGKQFRAEVGSSLDVPFFGKLKAGDAIKDLDVLLYKSDADVRIGAPTVSGVPVKLVVKSHERDDKVLVFKYLRKNKSKKMRGHRQPYTTVFVESIGA
jgi:large subunit ribosomal protein L21